MYLPKTKQELEKAYQKYGSTRAVARVFGCSQTHVVGWLRKFGIKAIPPLLHTIGGNTGKGRLAELYVEGHPYFVNRFKDSLQDDGDKSPIDGFLDTKKVNVKSSHWKRPCFTLKEKVHRCDLYICAWYVDKISRVIPREIWIIPSKEAPLSHISCGIRNKDKYGKYRLSLVSNKKDELTYNRKFGKKYSRFLPRQKAACNSSRPSFLLEKSSDRGFESYDVASQISIRA
ncbi:MAG: hypothetical protein WC220_00075 [Pedobacter sp.]|jgi:hypothetical protein